MRSIIQLCCVLTVALVGSLIPNVRTEAQDKLCFGLAPADCDILAAADANYARQTSFQFELTYSQIVSTITQRVGIELTGTGRFSIDTMPPLTDFALVGVLAFYTDYTDSLKLSMDFDERIFMNNSTRTVKGSTIVVDGVIYTKNEAADEWNSTNIADMIAQLQSSTGQANPLTALQEALHDPSVEEAIASMAKIKGFIKVTKSSKVPVVEGQNQIEFVYTYDLRRLFLSEEFYPVLKVLISSVGASVSDEQLALVAKGLAKEMAGSTFKFTRWVGSQDKLNHAFFAEFLLKIKLPASNPRLDILNGTSIKQRVAIKMTKIGQPVKIVAPEGATTR